jgi:hypothetical protein
VIVNSAAQDAGPLLAHVPCQSALVGQDPATNCVGSRLSVDISGMHRVGKGGAGQGVGKARRCVNPQPGNECFRATNFKFGGHRAALNRTLGYLASKAVLMFVPGGHGSAASTKVSLRDGFQCLRRLRILRCTQQLASRANAPIHNQVQHQLHCSQWPMNRGLIVLLANPRQQSLLPPTFPFEPRVFCRISYRFTRCGRLDRADDDIVSRGLACGLADVGGATVQVRSKITAYLCGAGATVAGEETV